MLADVDGDDYVDGLDGDALHGRTDEGGALGASPPSATSSSTS